MYNEIEIELSFFPKEYREFIEDTIAYANEHGVSVVLSGGRGVEIQDGSMANGFFNDEHHVKYPMTLAVACGQAIDQWFPVLVHESCHMDQYLEDCTAWTNNKVKGYDAWDIVDLWMDGYVDLNRGQVNKYIGAARDLELDCEERSVKKIWKHNLPIDIPQYIKAANAYVLFYNIMGLTKRWYELGSEPYNLDVIMDAMPDTFSIDFDNPPQHLTDLMFLVYSGTDLE